MKNTFKTLWTLLLDHGFTCDSKEEEHYFTLLTDLMQITIHPPTA